MGGLRSLVEILLWLFISISCIVWIGWWLIVVSSGENTQKQPFSAAFADEKINKHIHSRFFRTDAEYGAVLLYQSLPLIMLVALSFGVIELRKKDPKRRCSRSGWCSWMNKLTTYPIVAKSPLGVLTPRELIFLIVIMSIIIYSFAYKTLLDFEIVEEKFKKQPHTFKASLPLTKLAKASYNMARSAMIPFTLLWIPISRGSPILRLMHMSFESAIKYHTWLGTIMLSMLTMHGVGYSVYYVKSNRAYKILSWSLEEGESCAIVAGVVALFLGLFMWGTALPIVRRKCYEVFMAVHHFYILFVLFWLYHAVWTLHFFVVPCVLFIVDRFLRMIQSKNHAQIMSATLLPSGVIKLQITCPYQLQNYHALSSWYINFPSVSKVQWHMFSATSTPLDEKHELCILVKPLGNWTSNLRDQLTVSYNMLHDTLNHDSHGEINNQGQCCPFNFKARLEGPYGDESNFYLRYRTLVLIGGGIGVTPLLSILNDLLHRSRRGEQELPQLIKIYYCVRNAEELAILRTLDQISSSSTPHIYVSAYITTKITMISNNTLTQSLMQVAKEQNCNTIQVDISSDETKRLSIDLATTFRIMDQYSNNTTPSCRPISSLNPSNKLPKPKDTLTIKIKGEPMWVLFVKMASLLGFYLLWGLTNVYIVKSPKSNFPNYHRAHFVFISMFLGTVVFGGLIVVFWWRQLKNEGSYDTSKLNKVGSVMGSPSLSPLPFLKYPQTWKHEHASQLDIEDNTQHWNGNLQLGARPDWRGIFHSLEKEHRGECIGVLVSGPQGMQEDVAKECQRHNSFFNTNSSSTIFEYHSVSFEL